LLLSVSEVLGNDRIANRLRATARNRFDYGDVVAVSEAQLEAAIRGAQALLEDVQREFPQVKSKS
jgi:hypothetical protein